MDKCKNMQEVILSTGDLKQDYEVIDIVFATAGIENPYFAGPQYSESFGEIKKELKNKAHALGGNAVICARFEYQHSSGKIHELFAYGTCVRLK